MLTDSDPMAFVATARPAAARTFYEETLGLRLLADDPFAIVFDLHGTTLRVQKVETLAPHPFTALGWKVRDIAATIAALVERGVRFERYPGLSQDDGGVWATPDGRAKVAWFKDPTATRCRSPKLPRPERLVLRTGDRVARRLRRGARARNAALRATASSASATMSCMNACGMPGYGTSTESRPARRSASCMWRESP
jgi:catechol 2,3-dioxygenase-like lactoylglutathione lyase family enzyme